MAAFNLNIKNFDKVFQEVKNYPENFNKIINNEFKAFGLLTVADAKRLCPTGDSGRLKNSIISSTSDLKVSINVNADYAVYVEFGIKEYAARYVPTLPLEIQEYAIQFKTSPPGAKGGFMAQPFLFPAFEKNKIELIKNLKAQLNAK